jgi:O-antigen/teichoic acid export membrane protein
MNLKRILKLLAAFFTGQGVSIVTQLLIPPLFLHRYASGVELYGEWVALTAAVSYLNTLNSGIQTYANNQMAIHYSGGEVEQAKVVQASAVKLSIGLIFIVAVAGSTVLMMPLARWLHLKFVGSFDASLTVFLLTLQIVFGWLFSLLFNSYMVLGRAHRGQNWGNFQRLAAVLIMSLLLWQRASFPVLALSQLATAVLFTVLVAVDIRLNAPILLPSLRLGDARSMMSIIRPSAYFGLFSISGFLVWQGPVLLIQMILGPAAVAIFSLTRMLFNFSRLMLSAVTFSISQEITIMAGSQNWSGLLRLYDLSERVVLFLVTTVGIAVPFLCPLAFTFWLHKPSLYNPELCLLMAIVFALVNIKDHKIQFQYSTNRHQQLAVISLLSYVIMCGLGVLGLRYTGIVSLMLLWMAAEAVQAISILLLNRKLFPSEIRVSVAPVLRALVLLGLCFSVIAWPLLHSVSWSLTSSAAIAIVILTGASVMAYFTFGLREIRTLVAARLRQRFATVH